MEFSADVKYARNHEWIKQDGSEYIVGVSDFAQDELGDIVFVELPEVGEHFAAGKAFGVVESVKTASDVYLPVAGTVTAVNEALRDNPELINESPFDKGWIIKIQIDDAAELEALMDVSAYKQMVDA
ncbi:glycine cleavage system protein GcvH [Spirochaeta africana]|uniref:Glycine cleavage system H protein n=1 Tax=Spirochaeta africana (strain ATCC 700263 / DSM 8902 / Z-7692) TaxID=889378 RepID=H9UF26_SPIAZ|nr:glycine cleavage system protein GcvH [Spirochaeta africana]AFG36119.1 glycine cleavage system H protein [Spirochaeta africana DSM 8902]